MSFDAVPGVGQPFVGIDHDIANALVRSAVIIKVGVCRAGMPQATIANKPATVETFVFQGTEEAFDVGIAVWRIGRCFNNGDFSASQHLIEAGLTEFPAAVMDYMGDAVLG